MYHHILLAEAIPLGDTAAIGTVDFVDILSTEFSGCALGAEMFGKIIAFDPFAVCFDNWGEIVRNKTHDQLDYIIINVEEIGNLSLISYWGEDTDVPFESSRLIFYIYFTLECFFVD